MFGEELKALVDKYGIVKAAKIVNELSLYKFSSGKEYPNDYEVINRWVINKVERDEKIENNKKAIRKYKNYSQREYNGFEQFYDNL